MQFGLSNKTLKSLKQIFGKYGQISEVILYGSRAKGNFTEGSDIDLTIVGNNIDFSTLRNLSDDIDNLFLPYLVDISIHNTITNTQLLEHIKRVGKTIYTDSQAK